MNQRKQETGRVTMREPRAGGSAAFDGNGGADEPTPSLAIPDPRVQPVPAGWFETFAGIAEHLVWDDLDEAEAQLQALASYIESLNPDFVEFEKALRIIERRRGVLLGVDRKSGGPTPENFPRVESLGVAAATASRYRKIARHWEDVIWPHLLEAKKRHEVTQTKCLRLLEERRPTPPLPSDAFDVVYADPPWRYDFSPADSRMIERHYPTLDVEEICGLTDESGRSVRESFASNAVLFLWGTAPKLREALRVMDAWGFSYKSHAVWDKGSSGMGHWFRGRHELLLVGTRGEFSPPAPEHRIASVIRLERGQHSEKPEEIHAFIETWFPRDKYLELFARSRYSDRWTVWGKGIEEEEAA